MPNALPAASAFTVWMQLRLVEDERGFDHDLLEACERTVLTQDVTSDVIAIQVATVVQATMEDGEPNDRLAIHAMSRLINYITARHDKSLGGFASRVISEHFHPSSKQ